MKFVDAAPISGTRRTADGYLVTTARSVRTGIQLYAGHEVGRPNMPIVRVYRDAAEVFAPDSLQSFSHAPVTINHPDEAVTADNWKELSAGEVSTAAKQDGDWIMLPLILKDKTAIEAVEQGKRELSAGYTCNLDWTAGTTADGQAYDAQQRDIKINHLALVDKARAGSKARIGDGASWGVSPFSSQTADERKSPMADTLRKVLVDGLQVETTDAGAAAIEKLLKDLASSTVKISDLNTTHDAAIAAKDSEIGELKAKLVDTEKKVPTPEAIDKLVADRSTLIADAKAIHPDVKTDGIADADIRRGAVVGKFGDAVAKDASDAEILGMFKVAAADSAGDPVRKALQTGDHRPSTNDNGQSAYVKRISDAWKGA